MKFGTKTEITEDNGVVKSKITKYRDYEEIVNETICEERVQIMKIQDFDTIVAQMHVKHALGNYGAMLENKNGKLYVIKRWVEKPKKGDYPLTTSTRRV